MSSEHSNTEREVFPFADENVELQAVTGVTNEIRDRTTAHRDQMMNPQNVLKYRHGRTWSGPSVPYADSEGEFTNHSTAMETSFDDILKGDLSLVEDTIQAVTDAMNRSLSEMVFSTMHDATERTGNVVHGGSDKTFPEIMIEMYSKIKLAVDEEGNISLPTIAASPSQREKWEKEMGAMDDETAQKLNDTIGERAREAIADEQVRLAKFESRDDGSQ